MNEILSQIQKTLIALGIFFIVTIPASNFLQNGGFIPYQGPLFTISFLAAFIIMIIRPLADMTGQLWLRRLVLLRKGFGILSASIIVGFMLGKVIDPESSYLTSLFSLQFFSFTRYAFFAHCGDISGLILLITSNTFSQRLLKQNWKRIQRLSYAYFFTGGLYEYLALQSTLALIAMILVTILTVTAWWMKRSRREQPSA